MNKLILPLPVALVAFAMSACHGSDTPVAGVTAAATPAVITGAVMKPVVRDIAPPPKPVFSVRDYGAKGDGSTADTLAIQKAIDACAGTGGSVVLDGGDFVSSPLSLKSRMTFYVAKDARLLGSVTPADYPLNVPEGAAEGPFQNSSKRSLLSAFAVNDLVLDGGGEIDGRGQILLKNGMGGREAKRPSLLRVLRGKSVAVRNLTLRNAFMWTQVYDRCENLVIEKNRVFAPNYYGNLDGMDICNCHHVVIRDNHVDAADDAICLKSHGTAGIDDVLIENNTLLSSCNAIKLGTATVGPVTNLRILNNTVVFAGRSALAIMSVDGSHLTGMRVSGMTVTHSSQPIFLRLARRPSYWEMDPPGKVRPGNYWVTDPNEKPTGPPGSIDDILLENIRITATPGYSLGSSITGITARNIGRVTLKDMYVEMPGGRAKAPAPLQESDSSYPEADQFGLLPGYAFYISRADLVRFENVRCGYLADDVRPWLASAHAKVETVDCTDLKRVKALPVPEETAKILAASVQH